MTTSQFKQYFQNSTVKEKSYWNLKQSQKQELENYGIDQFQSISSRGRTYLLKIPHGKMRILYRSIQNYSSVEENTFLEERGIFGPYNTSLFPYYYYFHCTPYCYCCAHVVPILLLLCPIEAHYYYCFSLTLLLLCQL